MFSKMEMFPRSDRVRGRIFQVEERAQRKALQCGRMDLLLDMGYLIKDDELG